MLTSSYLRADLLSFLPWGVAYDLWYSNSCMKTRFSWPSSLWKLVITFFPLSRIQELLQLNLPSCIFPHWENYKIESKMDLFPFLPSIFLSSLLLYLPFCLSQSLDLPCPHALHLSNLSCKWFLLLIDCIVSQVLLCTGVTQIMACSCGDVKYHHER